MPFFHLQVLAQHGSLRHRYGGSREGREPAWPRVRGVPLAEWPAAAGPGPAADRRPGGANEEAQGERAGEDQGGSRAGG